MASNLIKITRFSTFAPACVCRPGAQGCAARSQEHLRLQTQAGAKVENRV